MKADAVSSTLSSQHPWPGLAAYDEASTDYFHGREREADALLQRILLAPLTVLYGRSGLGKSSLLMAGLFPRLREHAMLPVYLRLDFSAQAMGGPLQQAERLLDQAIADAGLEAPPRAADESLWHWLHRRDFELWSADNRLWTPVLVFDQFEELFSRTGGDDARIGAVFDALADLAENRIPHELADRREGRDQLDLSTQRYRMLLSFREDFLPDVRVWERKVPSLLRNDMRLVAMTRAQAVEAVQRAGAQVLADGVAPKLVDFVGGLGGSAPGRKGTGGARREAQATGPVTIEPALLSLCGAQLTQRLAPGRKIDAKLIAEAGEDILQDFYRRALAGMPERVHRFVEDHLLQGDRTRGSYARQEALDQGFITEAELATLTDERRLLRIEKDTGVPRIELIHDRLVDVVRRARDTRAAAAAAEAERSQRRRKVQWAVTGVMAVLLVASGLQTWRLTAAQRAADAARAAALTAAGEAQLAQAEAEKQAQLAEERLRQAQELLSRKYGWTGSHADAADTSRVQQALAADQALTKVQRASPTQVVAGLLGKQVRIQLFAKDVDQGKVEAALKELGYPLQRSAPPVADLPTNALWFGEPVPLEDVKVIALALMRSGTQLRAIRLFSEASPRRTDMLVQVGADRAVQDWPPWTVDKVLAATSFPR